MNLKSLFSFLFLIFSFTYSPKANAQNLKLPRDKNFNIFTFKNSYYIINSDSLFYTSDEKHWTKIKHNLKVDLPKMLFLEEKGIGYFFNMAGGSIYLFDGTSFKQICFSDDLDLTYNSYPFIFNQMVHHFGGYGMFEFKNFIIFFDPQKKEWEIVNVKNKEKDLPGPRSTIMAMRDEQNIYIADGESFDPNAEFGAYSRYNYRDVWKFNLNKLEWKHLGSLNPQLKYDDYFVLRDYHHKDLLFKKHTDEKFIVADIIHNKFQTFQNLKPYVALDIFENFGIKFTFNPNTNKFFTLINKDDNTVEPLIISEKNLIGNLLEEKQLYTPYHYKWYKYGSAALLILILLIVYIQILYHRKKQSLSYTEQIHLKWDNIRMNLNSEELRVLEILLENAPKPTQYPVLMQVFEINYGYESQVKKLRTTLQELDFKLQEILKTRHNLLIIKRSDVDKRIKEVQIFDK